MKGADPRTDPLLSRCEAYTAGRFEPGRDYAEREVNAVLLGVHEDFAYLRRELVNHHYLERADGRYRTAALAPERSAIERQEIPAREAHWLPGFLSGS